MPILLQLYLEAARNTVKGTRAAPWTLLLPVGLGAVNLAAGTVLAPLGIVGGFIMGLVFTALTSTFLHFVSDVVSGARVDVRELKASLLTWFWPIMSVGFVLWIGNMVLEPIIRGLPNGAALGMMISLVLFVLLNAVPECIYQKRIYGGIATIHASVEFIHANWIEWFIPNALLGAALIFGVPALAGMLSMAGVPFAGLALNFVIPALLFPAMVFRGHLFKLLELSPRQREFRYRKQ